MNRYRNHYKKSDTTSGNLPKATIPDVTLDPGRKDPFLSLLINFSMYCNFKPGITLFVGGMIISGHLSTEKSYLEDFAREWDENFSAVLGEEPRGEYGTSFIDMANNLYSWDEDGGDFDPPDPTFIHIEGARIWSPNGEPLNSQENLMFWRGRLNSVSGFILGELGDLTEDFPEDNLPE